MCLLLFTHAFSVTLFVLFCSVFKYVLIVSLAFRLPRNYCISINCIQSDMFGRESQKESTLILLKEKKNKQKQNMDLPIIRRSENNSLLLSGERVGSWGMCW